MNHFKNFYDIANLNWNTAVFDSGCENWTTHWFLDGENSRVYNHPTHGMEVYAGARFNCDADHTVLWTKETFAGDIKISYEFTRLDNADRCVNILYLMATGSGIPPYSMDISEWSALRTVPEMKTYFNHLNTYHISYAAFAMDASDTYIRARRYQCGGLNGTEQSPDYDPEDFFKPMEKHELTFIKKGNMLYFHIKNDQSEKLCQWQLNDDGVLNVGRIGFRQMCTRNSRYKNIEISTL